MYDDPATPIDLRGRAGRTTRRQFMRRAALAGAALGGLLLLGDGAMPAAAQAPLTPDELYQRLLSTRFEDRELPSGFTVMTAYQSTSTVQRIGSELPGSIGAAMVTLHGPDLQNTIWYYAFASEAEALDQFDNGTFGRRTAVAGTTDGGSQGPPTKITDAYEPDGFLVSAWCVAGTSGYWGWTSCRVLVGTVEVVGYSKVLPGSGATRGNDMFAISLARAGVRHLQRLG